MSRSSLQFPSEETLRRRFHLITGKGGVGKSAVTLALSLELARRGLRTLVCEVGESEMMTRAFEAAPSHSEIRELTPNLFAVSIRTQEALTEYGALKFKLKALSQLLSENPLTRALTALVPGVADLVAFGKAFNHERERDSRGLPLWDRVIIDAPSTGHGLTFVRLPQLISEVVPAGNIRREADEMWGLVSDASRSAVHVVTLAEELPVQETLELWRAFESDLKITPQALWVNRLLTPIEVDSESFISTHLDDQSESTSSSLLRRRLSLHRQVIHAQNKALEALSVLKIPQVAQIPMLRDDDHLDLQGDHSTHAPSSRLEQSLSELTLRELIQRAIDQNHTRGDER